MGFCWSYMYMLLLKPPVLMYSCHAISSNSRIVPTISWSSFEELQLARSLTTTLCVTQLTQMMRLLNL